MLAEIDSPGASQPMWLVSLNVFASKFLSGSSSNKKEI
jgi:hypothetical protein